MEIGLFIMVSFLLFVREVFSQKLMYFELIGLWESAIETQDSLFSRIAIVHLVHEARGLDVNPMQIKRCRTAGDHESADVMTIIVAFTFFQISS